MAHQDLLRAQNRTKRSKPLNVEHFAAKKFLKCILPHHLKLNFSSRSNRKKRSCLYQIGYVLHRVNAVSVQMIEPCANFLRLTVIVCFRSVFDWDNGWWHRKLYMDSDWEEHHCQHQLFYSIWSLCDPSMHHKQISWSFLECSWDR